MNNLECPNCSFIINETKIEETPKVPVKEKKAKLTPVKPKKIIKPLPPPESSTEEEESSSSSEEEPEPIVKRKKSKRPQIQEQQPIHNPYSSIF